VQQHKVIGMIIQSGTENMEHTVYAVHVFMLYVITVTNCAATI